MDTTQAEASTLEKKSTWVDDIPIANAKSKVLPGTWVQGLIGKIIKIICLEYYNPNRIPAAQPIFKENPDGRTTPDITFAVSQATIMRYLSETSNNGTIASTFAKPNGQ